MNDILLKSYYIQVAETTLKVINVMAVNLNLRNTCVCIKIVILKHRLFYITTPKQVMILALRISLKIF